MTQTVQFYSPASVNETGRTGKPEADDIRLLELLFDDLNNLYQELNNLDNILKKKIGN